MSIHESETIQPVQSSGIRGKSTRLVNVRMIPAKLTYFLYIGCIGAYVPYTNIFLRDVGLTVTEAGFISGIALLFASISSPLWGLLIDHTGRRKLIFLILSLSMLFAVFPLPFVAGFINPKVPSNLTEISESNHTQSHNTSFDVVQRKPFANKLFFVMSTLDVLGKVLKSPLHGTIDATIMAVLATKEPTATYGGQRVFGTIGYGLAAFLTGSAIDHYANYFENRHLSKYTTTSCVFLPIALLFIPVALYFLSQVDAQVRDTTATSNVSKKKALLDTFFNPDNIFFFITVIIVGMSHMASNAYLFMMMKDRMHSSRTIMGLSSLMMAVSQIVVFPLADRVVSFCGGALNAIAISLISYSIRFLLNSYITNPWFVIGTEALHSIGFGLFWGAATVHTQKISPTEIHVTMFNLVNSAYYGVGGLIANIAGGVVYHNYHGHILFRGLSVLCTSWTIIVVIFYHGYRCIQQMCTQNVVECV